MHTESNDDEQKQLQRDQYWPDDPLSLARSLGISHNDRLQSKLVYILRWRRELIHRCLLIRHRNTSSYVPIWLNNKSREHDRISFFSFFLCTCLADPEKKPNEEHGISTFSMLIIQNKRKRTREDRLTPPRWLLIRGDWVQAGFVEAGRLIDPPTTRWSLENERSDWKVQV